MGRSISEWRNPFRRPFYMVLIICCIILSTVFFCFSYVNNKNDLEKNSQDKAILLMKEWESQIQQMESIALDIVSNYEFHPLYFKENIANEWDMLKTFKMYKYQSSLSEEFFLDYGNGRIYKSTGGSLDLELFMREKSTNEEEKQRFQEELNELRLNLTGIVGEVRIINIFDEIYVLIPFKVSDGTNYSVAILGFVVENSNLRERFDVACGGLNGQMVLWFEEEIVYSTQDEYTQKMKAATTVVLQSEKCKISYQLKTDAFMKSGMFLMQILMLLLDGFIVIGISEIFAEKTYKPIKEMADEYRIDVSDNVGKDALEVIGNILDAMKEQNSELDLKIQENERVIREQALKMLIEGSFSKKSYLQLEKSGVNLVGPLYCAISIFFRDEDGVTQKFLSEKREELELLSNEEKDEYIYILCESERKLLSCICSNTDADAMNSFCEMVCEVAESFEYETVVGIGNIYRSLERVSSSWLESLDNVRRKKMKNTEMHSNSFVYNSKEVKQILLTMGKGDERLALEKLEDFINGAGTENISVLMLHTISADFLAGVREECDKWGLNVSELNNSLFVSMRSLREFESAAKIMIHDFVKIYEEQKKYRQSEESKKICEYIEAHFSEYDISCESIADYFGINRVVVRQAVLEQTGKLYRDYVIFLRIEYAKKLLQQENISVGDLCVKVGYSNVSYFVKLFREVTGVTPAKYRKMVSD